MLVRVDEDNIVRHLDLGFFLEKPSNSQTMSNAMRIFLSSNSCGIIVIRMVKGSLVSQL